MYPSETAACHSAPYDPFWTFWTWYARGTWLSWEPQTISFFGLGSWDKYLGHTCEKRKSSHSSTVRLLYCLANFSRAAHCLAVSRGFFCLLSGLQHLLFINLQMVFFPPSWPLLANCCESCLVEFPLLNLALILFRIIVLAASLRIFGLPIFFLSSNLSFLDDHFTTQSSDFFSFLEISFTDKPVDLSIDAELFSI